MNINFNAFDNHNFVLQVQDNEGLTHRLQNIAGSKWHPDCGMWSFPDTPEIINEVLSIVYENSKDAH
ncbi:MAG: hypothetical protein JW982_16770 [Spirochaetes bacterium]|nr:hypothetical protein [Spirochaetota bacterium]